MKLKILTFSLSTQTLLKEFTYIFSAALMMAALSRISIPLQPVPVTGQTLGVLLTGILLGRKRAAASMLIYIMMGAIGLPVFANGAFGIAQLIGPTGGYLLGFVPAAYLMGYLGKKGWYKHVATALLSLIIGTCVIFAFGVMWLANFTGWDMVLSMGVLPFLPGAAVKILIALTLIPILRISSK